MAKDKRYYDGLITALHQDLDELGSSIDNYLGTFEPLSDPEEEEDLKAIEKLITKRIKEYERVMKK